MSIELLPLADRDPGVHASAWVEVPPGARAYKLDVARCTPAAPDAWPGAEQTIEAQVELLVDGQWLAWGAFKAYGGQHRRLDGSIAETSHLIARIDGAPDPRRLRVTLTLSHALRTAAWLEFG